MSMNLTVKIQQNQQSGSSNSWHCNHVFPRMLFTHELCLTPITNYVVSFYIYVWQETSHLQCKSMKKTRGLYCSDLNATSNALTIMSAKQYYEEKRKKDRLKLHNSSKAAFTNKVVYLKKNLVLKTWLLVSNADLNALKGWGASESEGSGFLASRFQNCFSTCYRSLVKSIM